jgi:hypothetical protein
MRRSFIGTTPCAPSLSSLSARPVKNRTQEGHKRGACTKKVAPPTVLCSKEQLLIKLVRAVGDTSYLFMPYVINMPGKTLFLAKVPADHHKFD